MNGFRRVFKKPLILLCIYNGSSIRFPPLEASIPWTVSSRQRHPCELEYIEGQHSGLNVLFMKGSLFVEITLMVSGFTQVNPSFIIKVNPKRINAI